jgi:hypothetical protein
MSYINTATGAYPLSANDVRADFLNTSFPDDAAGFEVAIARSGYLPVQPVPAPEVDYTQNVTEGGPEPVDGMWRQSWLVSDASAEEIAERLQSKEAEVRQQRNELLSACDWTQLPDSPADHEVWATYRQELRDVTAQEGFPWDVVWPEMP